MIVTRVFLRKWLKKVLNKYGSKYKNIHEALKDKYMFGGYFSECHKKVQGDIFEYICKYILKQKYENVYLNHEIPKDIRKKLKLRNCDKGIDLIYEDNNKYIAVQCKWRGNKARQIKKCYVTEFLYEFENNSKIKTGLMMTSVKKITNEFDNLKNLKWFIYSDILDKVDSDFFNDILTLTDIIKVKRKRFKINKLRDYQEDCVKQLLKNKSKRMKCIMACGSGKTIIMYEFYKKYKKNKRTLFLFPSLQLVNQTYRKFRDLFKNKNILCVCSQMDKYDLAGGDDISKERAEVLLNECKNEYDIEYTTDKKIIDKRLKNKEIVVFCTYQSSIYLKNSNFDLAFFDEAHKTVNSKKFSTLIYDENCKINKRIFFTATPKYYSGNKDTVVGMDDKKIYGDIGYEYGFSKAIKDKHILDYDITYYTSDPNYVDLAEENYVKDLKKKDKLVKTNDFISAFMIAKHIKDNPKNKHNILTYHNTVNKSKQFAKYLRLIFKDEKINADVFTMAGTDRLSTRKEVIHDFSNSDISVICSARVLNEGVDISCVNTVVFVENRKSTIDIVQCIGRGMRLNGNENDKCHVILPIHFNNSKDNYEFSQIRNVLVAMGSVDDKLIEYFCTKNKKVKRKAIKNGGNILKEYDENEELDVKYSVGEIESHMCTYTMNSNLYGWMYHKDLLFYHCNILKNIPASESYVITFYGKKDIGSWFRRQKIMIKNKSCWRYIKLSKNKYVKKNLDNNLKIKKRNKAKTKYTPEELIEFVFKYFNNTEGKKIPTTYYPKYVNYNVGQWFHIQKIKIKDKKSKMYKKLSKNKFTKQQLDEYFDKKEKGLTRGSKLLTWEEWKDLSFEFSKETHPKSEEIYKGYKIGRWFSEQKTKIKDKDNEIYKILSENIHMKKSMDKKLNPLVDWEKNKIDLFRYFKKDGKVKLPKKINTWINDQKKRINDKNCEVYKRLSQNKYVKKSIDELLKKREARNGQKQLTREEKIQLLFNFCNRHKNTPFDTEKYDLEPYKNEKIGRFFSTQKGNLKKEKFKDKIYKELSVNIHVKEKLDEYIEKKKIVIVI